MNGEERQWLTIRQAARRVHRDPRTTRRWHAAGMRMVLVDEMNYVELEQLLAWYRRRLLANPCRQAARERRSQLEAAA